MKMYVLKGEGSKSQSCGL